MKENAASIIAVTGVVTIGLGVLFQSSITKQVADPELIKLIVTGLMSFASGAAVTKLVS